MHACLRIAGPLLLAAALLPAQTPTVPFHILGPIQAFTIDTADCAVAPVELCGGHMKVNGILVTIPRNSIIFFPARLLALSDIFRFKADTAGHTGAHPKAVAGDSLQAFSGLALEDPADFKPVAAFEADLTGNILLNPATGKTEHIAGLVHISQQSLNVSDAYILSINPALGEMIVGPENAAPGDSTTVRVRINDPLLSTGFGRYSRGGSFDERFTSDQDNATVRAATGFPMCIPGGNPGSCPASNRPTCTPTAANVSVCTPQGFVQRFTMGATDIMTGLNGPGVFPAPACTACDPKLQAPFAPGDRITFSGTLVQDAAGKYISAHTITAWLSIFAKDPAYLSIETSLIGTGGIPFSGVDQETGPGKVIPGATGTTRIKVEVLTTDPSRAVEVYALDYTNNSVDPLRRSLAIPGTAKIRPRGGTAGAPPIPRMILAPASKPPFGRLRLIVDRANYLPPPREIGVKFVDLVAGSQANANGVWSGQYEAPVGEFIFPENLVFGQRPIPSNFENFCFLAGSGPLRSLGRTANTPTVGSLTPFPVSGHSTPQSACP